eukprot:3836535-Pleurochrysis_carterae.AAC.1
MAVAAAAPAPNGGHTHSGSACTSANPRRRTRVSARNDQETRMGEAISTCMAMPVGAEYRDAAVVHRCVSMHEVVNTRKQLEEQVDKPTNMCEVGTGWPKNTGNLSEKRGACGRSDRERRQHVVLSMHP